MFIDLIVSDLCSMLEVAKENMRKANNSASSLAEFEYHFGYSRGLEFALDLFSRYYGEEYIDAHD